MRFCVPAAALLLLGACGEDGDDGDDGSGDDGTAGSSAGSTVSSGPADTGDGAGSGATSSAGTGDGGGTSGSDATGASTGGDEGPNVDPSDPQLYEFEIDPEDIDPTVEDSIETQFAHLDTRVDPLGKLVFFLSGYTNTPSSWRNHGRQLAGMGFHVVEPHYNNRWSCDGGPPNCNEDTRWEALTGEDTSSIVTIGRQDSAEGRVIAMLTHLQQIHPGGDWGYYLDANDTLRDEHVIIAGISHGASSSGLFATRRSFHRCVMHSGAWGNLGANPATPIGTFYGLAHQDDPQYDGISSAWESGGLLGAPTVIENIAPPYDDSHRPVATTPNGYPHCSVCVSPDSPMQNGEYVFDPAWRYIYGAPQ